MRGSTFAEEVTADERADGEAFGLVKGETRGRVAALLEVLESRFGAAQGTRPVIRALATLALDDPRRPAFWRSELLQAMKIVERGDIKPEAMLGSWAGAMGHTQFMPSTFNRFAVDHDGDGRRDIRCRLNVFFVRRQNVGHGIDQQSGNLAADLGDDDDMPRRRFGGRKPEAAGQIDDRQHRAAQVDDAADKAWRMWNGGGRRALNSS